MAVFQNRILLYQLANFSLGYDNLVRCKYLVYVLLIDNIMLLHPFLECPQDSS